MNISHDKNDTEVRVSIFSPALLIAIIILSFVGAIIGIQIIVTLGISANTSIIGAVLAILLSRIPLSIFASFKFIDAQNLIQTSISAATFAAASTTKSYWASFGCGWLNCRFCQRDEVVRYGSKGATP